MSSTCANNDAETKMGFFLRGGERKAIAGAGVEFYDFPRQFVLLLQNQPREIGGIFQVCDDDAFDRDAEALKDAVDEVVREWTFFWFVAEKHSDDRAHLRFDVDDENFFVIADEQRATAVGGENTADLHRHHIVLHDANLSHLV